MKIGYITSREEISGVEYHRLFKPLSLLDDVTRLVGVHQDILDMGFDVVIFNRHLPTKNQKVFIRELQHQGTYVICDIDDYWVLYSGHILEGLWKRHRVKQRIIEALDLVDEVWVTHKMLGNYVDSINANWYVIKNALDPNDPQWQPKKVYSNKIGWAGGITHYKDLKQIKFNRKPVICGYSEGWDEIVSLNPDAQYVSSSDVHSYGFNYELFDIAVAPLERNRFNKCKSNLKILEAGMKGIPIFVENIHPYTDDAQGIYKVDDWQDAIRTAESLGVDEIREQGQSLRKYILENYNLHDVNKRRLERIVGE